MDRENELKEALRVLTEEYSCSPLELLEASASIYADHRQKLTEEKKGSRKPLWFFRYLLYKDGIF